MVFTEDVLEGKKDAIIPVNNIFFSIGSDELLSISNSEIKRLSEFINTYNRSVVLSGHTDNTGTIENNQILSEKRANSVKQALINLGCNKEQLQTKGYGEMNPVASNDSKLGRQKNRRVELTFAN
ncbi:MAG TPA: OmpA family protein [Flavobacteriales bacterium]|nr:OmpA family protein [Flavobacteriales bacterium]